MSHPRPGAVTGERFAVQRSRERHKWINLMFDAMNPDEVAACQQPRPHRDHL